MNATFQGLPTIHSANAEKLLLKEFHLYTDLNTSAQYLYFATTRALALWLELVCVVYISTVTLSFLLFDRQNGKIHFRLLLFLIKLYFYLIEILFRADTMGGNVGLAISQALNLVFFCQFGERGCMQT